MGEKNKPPLVTVLMPVFNGETFLKEAIESILQQTFRDFEFLIVNDGSTDKTTEILDDFAQRDDRIRIVSLTQSQGLSSALNLGIDAACGKYIARMDADDISSPARLAKQVKAMEDDSQLIICGSYYRTIGAVKKSIRLPRKDKSCKSLLFLRSCFAHPAVMIRREILIQSGLRYPEPGLAEDYDLWSRMAIYGSFRNIPEYLLSYRVHAKQLSSSHSQLQRELHSKIAQRNFALQGINISAQELRRTLWLESRDTWRYMKDSRRILQTLFKQRGKIGLSPWMQMGRIVVSASTRSALSRIKHGLLK